MIGLKRPELRYQASHDQMESGFMSAPNIPLLTPYAADLQTYEYNFPIPYNLSIADNLSGSSASAAHPYLSWLEDVHQQLDEVRQESEEACELENEMDPVPDSAYDDAYWLLESLFYYHVSMPDIGWLMDGGIGFEWRSRDRKGIATMSIYGDNKVVYGASLGGTHRVKGTCALSNHPRLTSFLTKLAILFSD